MQPLSTHWADIAAARVVAQWGERETYTVASGITPSGVVHIGNFREEITVDFVARALKKLGKNVRTIHSWDDFDTFRKVPKNLPNQEMLATHLRRPINRVPDPFGDHGSYAEHNIKTFEKTLPAVGISPEFLYQSKRYASGLYAANIRQALEKKDLIRAILDEHRSEALPDEWLPTAIYCEVCDRDEMVYERYEGEWNYSYQCRSCNHAQTTDIRATKNLKLNWRTDWPMRWAFEQVDFEPGGKDHSSDGGSHDTARRIVKEVFGREPPVYLQYDFVSIKGGPGKMSSSSGNVVDLAQVLEVFAPEMVRWIFARQKPNTDFSIAFDEDVIKAYEEFDRLEELAYRGGDPKDMKWFAALRTYELSLPSGKMAQKKPFRPGFRVLCNRLQICGGHIERTRQRFYAAEVTTDADRQAFAERAERAWRWLGLYAPDDFKYALNDKPLGAPVDEAVAKAVAHLKQLVVDTDLDKVDPKDLNQAIYDRAIHASGVDSKAFFAAVYQRLIRRDQGPRLPGFLKEIGKEKLLELL